MWAAFQMNATAGASPPATDRDTPRFRRQVRLERFMKEAAEEWQSSHDVMRWLLLDDAHLRSIYAAALVDYVQTLANEVNAEAEEAA